jgi:hypothetical protein
MAKLERLMWTLEAMELKRTSVVRQRAVRDGNVMRPTRAGARTISKTPEDAFLLIVVKLRTDVSTYLLATWLGYSFGVHGNLEKLDLGG